MKILLYYHAGSRNHGCEAIVRTLCDIFKEDQIILYSFDSGADKQFGLEEVVSLKECLPKKERYSIKERIQIRLGKYQEGQECYSEMLDEKGIDWAFAIGGDNYCYKGQPEEMAYINREFKKRGIKTALVGCSIDKEVIENRAIRKDLERYDIILARESLTYEALRKKNLTNIFLCPDSAFLLRSKETDKVKLPKDISYIGINVSPLVVRNESKKNVVYDNYVKLIQYILNQSSDHILLIPHVCVEWDSDLAVLTDLYNEFKDSNRITMIPECGCEELKYYISKCSFVICARTHVSIAAYSLSVPTLVIGYSIKSKGIACDLFGDYKDYVIEVKEITAQDTILNYFLYLSNNQEEIRKVLENKVDSLKMEVNRINGYFVK